MSDKHQPSLFSNGHETDLSEDMIVINRAWLVSMLHLIKSASIIEDIHAMIVEVYRQICAPHTLPAERRNGKDVVYIPLSYLHTELHHIYSAQTTSQAHQSLERFIQRIDETTDVVKISRPVLLETLSQIKQAETIETVRSSVVTLRNQLYASDTALHSPTSAEATIAFDLIYLTLELNQIVETRTLERARYYIERLMRGITQDRTSGINDINLNRWKEYDHVLTDSLWITEDEERDITGLWIVERRDSSGVHMADYWGNFIPQIPHQMMQRYTRQGEWVLDTFAGSGTTLIEGQRLGRNTLGIELQATLCNQAMQRVQSEDNPHHVVCEMVTGDSTTINYHTLLQEYGQHTVQLVIMHPPYFDIIKFSDDERDLSHTASVDDFLTQMDRAVENVIPVLERGRYLVLVIGDKYTAGTWIPLGFYTMQVVTNRGLTLRSIIVKNFETTTGKRNQKELWRYRALAHGFYIFKHEYIFLFKKE